MRILVLGGTRFVGKALAACLIESGQDVVVSSRRPQNAPLGSVVIGGERSEVIKRLAGENFDCVVDFTCYGGEDAKAALAAFSKSRIVFISSIWVTRLIPGMVADAPFQEEYFDEKNIPAATLNYLLNKVVAERDFYAAWQAGRSVTIVRLPIIWGDDDHTDRLDFYRRRLLDNHPLILVDGGSNLAQISWSSDVAKALTRLVLATEESVCPILEACTDSGRSIIEIATDISKALGVELKTVSISADALAEHLPNYLNIEPLWRENGRNLTANNLFKVACMNPVPMSEWLSHLSFPAPAETSDQMLRVSELAFIQMQDIKNTSL